MWPQSLLVFHKLKYFFSCHLSISEVSNIISLFSLTIIMSIEHSSLCSQLVRHWQYYVAKSRSLHKVSLQTLWIKIEFACDSKFIDDRITYQSSQYIFRYLILANLPFTYDWFLSRFLYRWRVCISKRRLWGSLSHGSCHIPSPSLYQGRSVLSLKYLSVDVQHIFIDVSFQTWCPEGISGTDGGTSCLSFPLYISLSSHIRPDRLSLSDIHWLTRLIIRDIITVKILCSDHFSR